MRIGRALSRGKLCGRTVESVLEESLRLGKTPINPADEKARIVLGVIAGEMAIAEAARRE